MHLTYEQFHLCADDAANDHAINSGIIGNAVTLQALNPGLGDLGGLISKLLDFKKKITPGPLKKLVDLEGKVLQVVGKNAKFIAPIAAFIPVVGWIVGAAVAVVGADYNRAQQKSADLKALSAFDQANREESAKFVQQYQAMAGTVPGRLIGEVTLRDILKAWLPHGAYGQSHPPELYNAAADTLINVASKAVAKGIARGASSLLDIYDTDFPAVLAESPQEQWLQPQDGTQAQLIIDAMDLALARQAPNSAITYGVKVVPVETASSTTPAGSAAETVATPAPVTATVPTTSTTPTISADVNTDMLTAIQAMIARGQSADAATKNILAALANKNVSANESQTAAIKAAAEKTAAGQVVTAGTTASGKLLLGLGAVALLFALARPAKRGQSK